MFNNLNNKLFIDNELKKKKHQTNVRKKEDEQFCSKCYLIRLEKRQRDFCHMFMEIIKFIYGLAIVVVVDKTSFIVRFELRRPVGIRRGGTVKYH
jgi:predicted nucleic acid-binding Zn ribbon protein